MSTTNINIEEAADRALKWLDSVSDEELIAALEQQCDGPVSYAFSWDNEFNSCDKPAVILRYLLNDPSWLRTQTPHSEHIFQGLIPMHERLAANDAQYILAA